MDMKRYGKDIKQEDAVKYRKLLSLPFFFISGGYLGELNQN